MDKLLLVDGSNLLFQMFYGMPARIVGKHGKAIHGTVGFIGALLKIIRLTDPTHAAVFFDGEHKNIRTEINADYKANRPDFSQMPEEETPFSQLTDIFKALDCIGIRYAETTVCEADDWMAGYAKKYGTENTVTILSHDSDLFQLINKNVCVLRYRGDNSVLRNEEYIKEKLKITPQNYATFKSLTGDSSDNIKGVYKIGPKTAADLVNRFGGIEEIIAGIDKIEKPSLRVSLSESIERMRLNYKLICLDGCFNLPFELSDISFEYNGITTTEVLTKIGLR